MTAWVLIGAGAALALYAAFVAALLLGGRRGDARALAGFVPDCAVLIGRLLREPKVPRRLRLALGALVVYLAVPIDIVPDAIPVLGQLDDAILVAWVLRSVVRVAGPETVRALWPGPERSLAIVLRLATGTPRGRSRRARVRPGARTGGGA